MRSLSNIIIYVVTVPQSLTLLRGQLKYMRRRGMRAHVVTSAGDEVTRFQEREGVPVHAVDMQRRVTPLRDLVAVSRMSRLFRRVRPAIVNASTPKGGLLGMIAAWVARVPVRVYVMRGLPLVTARGAKRALLRWTEKVSCALAHRVICISPSLRAVAIEERLSSPEKLTVLGAGSSNGVDAQGRFNPERFGAELRNATRAEVGIPADALVVGFVGRVVRDKGIVELEEAWRRLSAEFTSLRLLMVGTRERGDPPPADVWERLRADPRVHRAGQVDDVTRWYAAMDLLVFPTYREGFGNVAIEAGAMALPVVATDIPGVVDAVSDGETGTLVPPGDALALTAALRKYIQDAELRRSHGRAGRERTLRDFCPEVIWEGIHEEYRRLLRIHLPGEARPPRAARLRTPVHVAPASPDRAREVARRGEALARHLFDVRRGAAEVFDADRQILAAGSRRESLAGTIAKRLFDIVPGSIAIVLLSPLMIGVAVMIWLTMGAPVVFRQTRAGRHGRPFTLLKFRTMTDARGPDGALLSDARRLTPVGSFLRSTSLDELPQLWNVLRGDMSLVGPRPLLMEYLPLYSPAQARRLDARPGLTGWAQVNGRNTLSWEDRFALDAWYVDHRGLWLDLKILLRTVGKVFAREGISQRGSATMGPFRGSVTVSRSVAEG